MMMVVVFVVVVFIIIIATVGLAVVKNVNDGKVGLEVLKTRQWFIL